MLHPSYTELIAKANEGVEPGDEPVVQSRYSIVCATAKRARQLVDEANKKRNDDAISEGVAKPLSDAVKELDDGKIYIMTEEEYQSASDEMKEEVQSRVAAILEARAIEAQVKDEIREDIADSEDDDDDEVVDIDDEDDEE